MAAETTSLDHRRFLKADPRPFRDSGLFERIGGIPAVTRLLATLYDGLASDPGLRALFDRDLTAERKRQELFFAELLGGPAAYSDVAWAGLAHRHGALPITRAHAGLWLGHFRRALEGSIEDAGDRRSILDAVRELALGLVNETVPHEGSHGICLPSDHPLVVAADLARRGDLPALRALHQGEPALLDRPLHGAAILHQAALAGRREAVAWLLDRGVDVDLPHNLPVGVTGPAFERIVFVTPLAAARLRRRSAVVALLRERGAREDVFTAAFLGDAPAVERLLAAAPSLAQAPDPACDVVEVTPVHHAISGGDPRTVALLLDNVSRPLRGGERALRGAAARGLAEAVTRLLALGADARKIGPGRWVLDPAVAAPLAAAGATVADQDSHWIGTSCTGNQGRRDDPDYVRALLRHGARVEDRRAGSGGTALHHAARAGFLQTITVLLDHGADPTARDDEGDTPLDWLDRARGSFDRQAVRTLLTRGRRPGAVI